MPVDADLVFDVRFLPNPHFVPTLRRADRPRPGGGRRSWSATRRRASSSTRLEEYLRFVVPHYVAEGKSYLTIAIGCTGGRHRSVMIAEALSKALGGVGGARVRVRHRDIAHA